jgi:hypothetical protein
LVGKRTAGSAPARDTGAREVTGFGPEVALWVGEADAVRRVAEVLGFAAAVRVALGVAAFVVVDVVAAGVVGGDGVVVLVIDPAASAFVDDWLPPHPETRVRDSARRGTAYRRGRRIAPPLCPFGPPGTSKDHPSTA